MGYTKFRNGFQITTNSAIDKRLVLSVDEMKNIENLTLMPEVYLALCKEDGKLYIYDNRPDVTFTPTLNSIGHFKPIDDTITFESEESQTIINNVIENNEVVQNISSGVQTVTEKVTTEIEPVIERVTETIEPKVNVLETNVTTVIEDVGDKELLPNPTVSVVQNIANINTAIKNIKMDGGDIE